MPGNNNNKPKPKGFKPKPFKKTPVSMAPPAERDASPPQDKTITLEVSSDPVGTKDKTAEQTKVRVARGIFGTTPAAKPEERKPEPAEKVDEASKPRSLFGEKPPAPNTLRLVPTPTPPPPPPPKKEDTPAPTPTPTPVTEAPVKKSKKRMFKLAPGEEVPPEETPTTTQVAVVAPSTDIMTQLKGTELEELAKAIQAIEKENPYRTELPKDGFVPESRRGFSPFILQQYKRFMLPLPDKKPDYNACLALGKKGAEKAEMYQYQEFVREYMRWETPYRGVLVYHGLGSGKTCTAIAASEALFASGGRKRIIVMTPKSLRKNFIKEITKCGFRHFRLQNHWVPFTLEKANPMVYMFATKVLRIPESYVKRQTRIWIPDFRKEPNFDTLSQTDASAQQEIRNQIEATLVYDPFKKKDGLIWFVNYNGIQADQLKTLACQPGEESPFDNAVIVIDEVHNVVRNIQGTIDPYLLALPNKQRKVPVEPITPFKWNPELCGGDMGYKRAYLMYRLLVGAKNSKIIGLSGTPLINFPEELGILANILHGYIHYATARIPKAASVDESEAIAKKIEQIGHQNKFVDYVKAKVDDTGIECIVTMLPERIQKLQDKQGVTKDKVERIPDTVADTPFKARVDSFVQELATAKISLVANSLQYKSEAVLPPFFDQFKSMFLTDDMEIKNQVILMKRLTGLISYYKGSRKDLMPTVTNDIVVRVPMTPYLQEKYSLIRKEEIDQEERQKKQKVKAGQSAVVKSDWSLTTDIKKLKLSNSYRMGSRQICNFAFPPGVNRPRPADEKEKKMEIGDDDGGDIIDEVVDERFGEDDEDTKSILSEDDADREKAKAEDEAQEQREFDAFLETLRAELTRQGRTEAEINEEIQSLRQAREDEKVAATVAPPAKANNALRPAASTLPKLHGLSLCAQPQPESEDPKVVAKRAQDCGAAQYEDEDYPTALARAKRCLCTHTREYLRLDGKLKDISPKYHAMITQILATKGSSLVYSQFLDMEGIGIFTLVLDSNKWMPIKINLVGGKATFDPATLASFQEGADKEINRYIKFTGGEEDVVRKMSVDLFNANFAELPAELQEPLRKAGFKDNKRGQLCRLFCITSAGAEGLSLKNVRAVHIMESYWNDVRLTQVKGRAVRICSHMDLEPDERTVDIYTYISVYSAEAQVARTGDLKIDQSILMKDGIPASTARDLGITDLPEGAEQYVATSDDYLFLVSQRKKKVMDSLQKLMKMSAVDCELNILENDDGTYTCKVFKGEPGDFMYHPLLAEEIKASKSKYAPVDMERMARQKVVTIRIQGIPHKLKPVFDYETGQITMYEFYELSDTEFKNRVGSVKVDENGQIIPSTALLNKK